MEHLLECRVAHERMTIAMLREERRGPMRMRRTNMDNNMYRWEGHMLLGVARVRRHRGLPEDWRTSELSGGEDRPAQLA